MERLFVLKSMSRTQRATKVEKFVGFSLKPLRCRDPALPALYAYARSAILSVDDYSRTTGYEAAYERYQQLQCYKGMKNNVAILLKRLRSRDMA